MSDRINMTFEEFQAWVDRRLAPWSSSSGSRRFKRGDIVTLKSGGPRMTVDFDRYCRIDEVSCVWFDGERAQDRIFNQNVLVLVDAS